MYFLIDHSCNFGGDVRFTTQLRKVHIIECFQLFVDQRSFEYENPEPNSECECNYVRYHPTIGEHCDHVTNTGSMTETLQCPQKSVQRNRTYSAQYHCFPDRNVCPFFCIFHIVFHLFIYDSILHCCPSSFSGCTISVYEMPFRIKSLLCIQMRTDSNFSLGYCCGWRYVAIV